MKSGLSEIWLHRLDEFRNYFFIRKYLRKSPTVSSRRDRYRQNVATSAKIVHANGEDLAQVGTTWLGGFFGAANKILSARLAFLLRPEKLPHTPAEKPAGYEETAGQEQQT